MLAGDDEPDRTAVLEIIAGMREALPPRRPTLWNERERADMELHAWLRGRRRICDLAEVCR